MNPNSNGGIEPPSDTQQKTSSMLIPLLWIAGPVALLVAALLLNRG